MEVLKSSQKIYFSEIPQHHLQNLQNDQKIQFSIFLMSAAGLLGPNLVLILELKKEESCGETAHFLFLPIMIGDTTRQFHAPHWPRG